MVDRRSGRVAGASFGSDVMLWPFPQWYYVQGGDDWEGFEEYTDSEEVADDYVNNFDCSYEEVDGPSDNCDLNQPQTWLGIWQTR